MLKKRMRAKMTVTVKCCRRGISNLDKTNTALEEKEGEGRVSREYSAVHNWRFKVSIFVVGAIDVG